MTGALDGKRALVVGGTLGIGAAVAREFLREGARVVVASRRGAVGAEVDCPAVSMDVTSQASVDAAVAQARDHLGGIDILVNSAGVNSERYWDELDAEEMNRILDINVTGTFRTCAAVIPEMVERGAGRIINFTSQLAYKGSPGLAHYAASKAAIIAMSKSLALELTSQGVLINCVAPGPVNTQMTDQLTDEWRAAKASQLPLGRFGEPHEVAPAVVLLASDPGGNLFVGQTLGPNSGDVMP
ncbi:MULTISPECIES: SDR family NAD(P)-dependent oxidoreductase [Microbacterium]|uniref:SDR family NAD(P)-dependent oxidoreductase n=1 Tax=Microbacterium TaxID=33882 RepID=UPI001D37304C|nr:MULTISPECIES: SDR family oxidoreductase [Microbacterium]CAH0177137.1 3-oxoacyl-[acyl-carrier-protein] reductase FabG [Microbacterium foliorum]CAH0177261.1 3-oxoacyl-[acyl-carrier-protein] reductase FabG [Microbacterium oxydans]CAH0206539.1 3-oxoacyl-[acyl-carrier-protein] reductase FabG [Microbacterium foliorum]